MTSKIKEISRYKRQTYFYMIFSAISMIFVIVALGIIFDTNVKRHFSVKNGVENEIAVNVVFADYEEIWSEVYVKTAIADPLVLLHSNHLPKKVSQINVLIFSNGIPFGLRKKNAVAMYSPNDNVIIVDGDRYMKLRPSGAGGLLSIQHMIIAHEGMHYIQATKGAFKDGLHETDNYYEDPVEIEAMTEGVTIANILDPEYAFSVPFGGTRVVPNNIRKYNNKLPEYQLSITKRSTVTKWIRRWI